MPPAPAGLLDDHVARAMDVLRRRRAGSCRSRRATGATPWWQRIPLGAVAAALVVVALVGVAGLGGVRTGTTTTPRRPRSTRPDDRRPTTAPVTPRTAGGQQETTADAMEESAPSRRGASSDRPGPLRQLRRPGRGPARRAGLARGRDEPDAPPTRRTSTAATSAAARTARAATDPCGAVALLGIDPARVVVVRTVRSAPTRSRSWSTTPRTGGGWPSSTTRPAPSPSTASSERSPPSPNRQRSRSSDGLS